VRARERARAIAEARDKASARGQKGEHFRNHVDTIFGAVARGDDGVGVRERGRGVGICVGVAYARA
jgi:hypothetical protein